MSGGKTNNGKVPIVNYIAKSPKGAHFLAAVDMHGLSGEGQQEDGPVPESPQALGS
jgi:hypothetical protein